MKRTAEEWLEFAFANRGEPPSLSGPCDLWEFHMEDMAAICEAVRAEAFDEIALAFRKKSHTMSASMVERIRDGMAE